MEYICKLNAILTERNITNEEFTDKIGISRAALKGIINNETLPSFSVAFHISEILKMDIRDIWIRVKEQTADGILDDYIESLELSVRAENALRRKRIVTVRDLLDSDFDFKKIRGVGEQIEAEIINKISEVRTRIKQFNKK
ncbi:DNA-directed RNA polymerase subunit alpha C-terminal domain-containing protein [Heyndrickxia sp. NPDC080065]|uniref:DNA-directed RNA polymerase subunit alpha C-terminal domain-containing protein n=1 Tax=Heyndrickxia sp. NPDC080065 TaxID=3390568 RepID=UPI003D004714